MLLGDEVSELKEFTIEIDLAKYKYIDLEIEEAKKFLEELVKIKGKEGNDVKEVFRYLENFDEFYNYMKRKFKDFLLIPHKPEDYLKSNVIVDKVKLYISNDGVKRVIIVIDRRVATDDIKRALSVIGYDEIKVRKLY